MYNNPSQTVVYIITTNFSSTSWHNTKGTLYRLVVFMNRLHTFECKNKCKTLLQLHHKNVKCVNWWLQEQIQLHKKIQYAQWAHSRVRNQVNALVSFGKALILITKSLGEDLKPSVSWLFTSITCFLSSQVNSHHQTSFLIEIRLPENRIKDAYKSISCLSNVMFLILYHRNKSTYIEDHGQLGDPL